MKRIVVCLTAFFGLLGQCAVTAQDKTAHEQLKKIDWIIGEWEAETKVPPRRPDVGEEGATMELHTSWRWMLKKDFMVLNLKHQIGNKTEVGREIVGWDAESGQLVHWLFWEGGKHGTGEWTMNDDKLRLKWSMVGPNNKQSKGTSLITKIDADTVTWQGTDLVVDGKNVPDWPVITYKRKTD